MNIKTTKITNDPAPPVQKFVDMIWYQAHKDNVSEIILIQESNKCRILLDKNDIPPPPVNIFGYVIKQLIKYAGIKIWPWTKSINSTLFCIELHNAKTNWTINSEDISKQIRITRS